MEKLCGIYEILFSNGKSYVGQSVDIYGRWRKHKYMSLQENKHQPVHFAMSFYNESQYVFNVLELCNREDLNRNEVKWILEKNSISPNGYNLHIPEKIDNIEISEELREKLRLSHLGYKHTERQRELSLKAFKDWRESLPEDWVSPLKGRKITNEEILKNMSLAQKGKPRPLQSIKKMKETKNKNCQKWVTNKETGKSKQVRLDFDLGENWIEGRSNIQGKRFNTRKIKCLTTGEIFMNVAEAEEKYPNAGYALHRPKDRKSYKNYLDFCYIEEKNNEC